jgi:rSAM/selenodomain-associated transferase 1
MAWQVAILARAPVPGAAKTRLIPRLGAEGAATLQAHLIERVLQRAQAAGARTVLWLSGAPDDTTTELARRFDTELREQPAGDLGARMLAAARHAHATGMAAIIVGTDCPAQRPDDLRHAHQLLATHDVVLQPADDGGYVLIAMNDPHAELFSGIRWGSEVVLDETRQRCSALGLRCTELRSLPDLDHPDDLDRAVEEGWLERGRWS